MYTSKRPLENGNSLLNTCKVKSKPLVINGNHIIANVKITIKPIKAKWINLKLIVINTKNN